MTDPLDIVDATWPAARMHRHGPWLVREGRGGGQRVSAASLVSDWTPADIALAERVQADLGQVPLFRLSSADGALDAELERRGYEVVDPVLVYAAPPGALREPVPPPLTVFELWEPLAVQREIWAEGGIGAERVAVMERAEGAKTALLGRIDDRPAGAGFVAMSGRDAMLHALHVAPEHRRKGLALAMMRGAAAWAADQGAERFLLVVTRENAPARALYEGLGMQVVGDYHYRRDPASARPPA